MQTFSIQRSRGGWHDMPFGQGLSRHAAITEAKRLARGPGETQDYRVVAETKTRKIVYSTVGESAS